MQEIVFFDIDGVTVTNKRLIVNGSTYAMHSVTHVEHMRIAPSRFGPIWLGLFGLIALLFGETGQIVGAFMIFGAPLWLVAQKPTWTVVAGPARVNSYEREFAEQLVEALNAALASQ